MRQGQRARRPGIVVVLGAGGLLIPMLFGRFMLFCASQLTPSHQAF
jgi:hypothetical protein